jgi:hypothetical protein
MRHSLLALSILLLSTISGCVWPPDSTDVYNNQYYPYNAGFDVHRVSQRSLTGVETVATTISPYYNSYYYSDSIRYILVNGDTAYRHPVIALPPVYDSAVPFHTDGSANFVTFVYSSLTFTDTSYESGLTALITAPKPGDTTQRASDLLVSYQTNNGATANNQNGYVQITDSSHFYTQTLNYTYSGTLDFPTSEMGIFQGNTLWIDLHFTEVASDEVHIVNPNLYSNYISVQREVDIDRIVAYPLH